MRDVNLTDIYWVAAFLEGEGYFHFTKTTLYIQAGQVQRWPLDRCQSIMGGTMRLDKKSLVNPKWRDAYRWQLAGEQAVRWMMTVYAIMSPWRKQQIIAALAEWRTRKPTKVARVMCPYGHGYTTENTRFDTGADGYRHRHCITCARLRSSAPGRRARRAFHGVVFA